MLPPSSVRTQDVWLSSDQVSARQAVHSATTKLLLSPTTTMSASRVADVLHRGFVTGESSFAIFRSEKLMSFFDDDIDDATDSSHWSLSLCSGGRRIHASGYSCTGKSGARKARNGGEAPIFVL